MNTYMKLIPFGGYFSCLDQYYCNILKQETEFNKLWIKYGGNGNKLKAKAMYLKVRNSVSQKFLENKVEIYLQYLQITGNKKLKMSTWLNPRYKEYYKDYSLRECTQKLRKEVNRYSYT